MTDLVARTPTTLDAAWEALREDLDRRGDGLAYPTLAEHRPTIEAEARAEALRDVREAVNAFGFAAKPQVLAAIDRLASEDRP
mgnify:CR=1 FL=1